MKKTFFISALALCSVVAQAATVEIDFGRSDSQTVGALNVSGAVTDLDLGDDMEGSFSLAGSAALTATFTPGQENEYNWKENFRGELPFSGMADSYKDGLFVQQQHGTATQTITLTFSGLAAGTYSMEVFGGFYGKDRFPSVTYTLSGVETTNTTWTNKVLTSSGWVTSSASGATSGALATSEYTNLDNKQVDKGTAVSIGNITVADGQDLVLTIAGTGSYFERTPINYVSLSQVPEPASATLSLLALAAMAARRRRK